MSHDGQIDNSEFFLHSFFKLHNLVRFALIMTNNFLLKLSHLNKHRLKLMQYRLSDATLDASDTS